MEERTFKNVNDCLNTTYLDTSGGQCCSFFKHLCELDICGSLRQLLSCIGVQYVQFHIAMTVTNLFAPKAAVSQVQQTGL